MLSQAKLQGRGTYVRTVHGYGRGTQGRFGQSPFSKEPRGGTRWHGEERHAWREESATDMMEMYLGEGRPLEGELDRCNGIEMAEADTRPGGKCGGYWYTPLCGVVRT